MNKPAIMLIESADANVVNDLSAESCAIKSLGNLLELGIDVRTCRCAGDLERFAVQFNSFGYCALYFSAHGDQNGLGIPDRYSVIGWDYLVKIFDFKVPDLTSLILSSCQAFDGNGLVEAFSNSPGVKPKNLFGFKDPLAIRDCIPAASLLLRAMSTNDSAEIAAAMASVYLSTKADLWHYVHNEKTNEYDYVGGEQILRFICDPTERPKGWFDGLIRDRGLCSSLN
ncbi:MAG: hypothetical protein Q9O74_04895 [Planctomycetota bacterium]|nr:hypothetical protein [Planctomycetota bacterium]